MICPNCGVDKESTLASAKMLLKERDEAVSAVQRLSAGQQFDAVVIVDMVKRRTAQLEEKLQTYESIISRNNTMLEVAEYRVEQLEAENKRLREALKARRDWFAMQIKSASKGNFSEWDLHALQIELDAANAALTATKGH